MSESTSSSSRIARASLLNASLPLFIAYAGACVALLTIKDNPAQTTLLLTYAIPVLGVLSLISGWGQSYLMETSRIGYLIKQALAWGGLWYLVQVLGVLGVTTALGPDKSAVLLIALIGFTMLIAGIALDWKLFFVGVFIAAAVYMMAYPTDNPIATRVIERMSIAGENKDTWVLIYLAIAGFLVSFVTMWLMRGAIYSKRLRRASGRS